MPKRSHNTSFNLNISTICSGNSTSPSGLSSSHGQPFRSSLNRGGIWIIPNTHPCSRYWHYSPLQNPLAIIIKSLKSCILHSQMNLLKVSHFFRWKFDISIRFHYLLTGKSLHWRIQLFQPSLGIAIVKSDDLGIFFLVPEKSSWEWRRSRSCR